MSDREPTESVETEQDGYGETRPATSDDVERARELDDLLSSSPGTVKDRSSTGESHPVEFDEVEGPAIDD
jgi:hypothetical protein